MRWYVNWHILFEYFQNPSIHPAHSLLNLALFVFLPFLVAFLVHCSIPSFSSIPDTAMTCTFCFCVCGNTKGTTKEPRTRKYLQGLECEVLCWECVRAVCVCEMFMWLLVHVIFPCSWFCVCIRIYKTFSSLSFPLGLAKASCFFFVFNMFFF